jgi:site-specific DNA recombinase
MISFAFYGRVSTEDQQDPVASKAWQLHRSRQLIETHGGVVIAEYFDIGQSRSLPWKRRPEATRLLEDFRNPAREFTAIVIGEPQRAFYGNQFGLTFPVLTHYNVELWVPEVGGRVDPGSEAHDLVMTLFGGMSKGERTRIKMRVRSAMTSQTVTEGRFLGGRPPYGYRLKTLGPHPKPDKAALGLSIRGLEPDPETSPVVQRIFDEFIGGRGYFAIAERLTCDQIPSPSGHDRARNPHRHGLAWGKSAVRAILLNPRYTGFQVWNKQRKDEILLDVDDVASGHQTVQRWNDAKDWAWSTSPAHDALVSVEVFEQTQAIITSRSRSKPRTAKQGTRTYVLSSRISCSLCGRKLFGQMIRDEPYYRCRYPAEYANSLQLDHPKSTSLRERNFLPQVDQWLSNIFSTNNIKQTAEAIAVAAVSDERPMIEMATYEKQIAECRTKMNRYRAALEAGTDPTIVSGWIADVTAVQSAAEARLRFLKTQRPAVTPTEIEEMVREVGELVGLLEAARPELRAQFYEGIHLTGVFNPKEGYVDVTADLGARVRFVSARGLEPPRGFPH